MTRRLMPSGPDAESELRFDSKLSTLSGVNDTESRNSWVRLGKVGTKSDGFGTQYLITNMVFRHLAFSRAVSAVWPFDVIGQAVPKLRPFICQPMTRHDAMTSQLMVFVFFCTIDVTILLLLHLV